MSGARGLRRGLGGGWTAKGTLRRSLSVEPSRSDKEFILRAEAALLGSLE